MEKLVSYLGTEEIIELPLGLVYVRPEAMNWLRGTRGELMMARELAKLGPEWTVLHSIPVRSRGDIDHIVVGPAGVFPINTKRLVDREVRVDGERFRSDGWTQSFLRKAAEENDQIVRLLTRHGVSAPVLPIIAISGARSVKVRATPRWHERNIGVAPVGQVVRRLKSRRAVLDDAAVARAVEVLRDSRTWSSRPAATGNDPALLHAFRRIDRGVGRLRHVMLVTFSAFLIVVAWWASSAFIAAVIAVTAPQ